MNIRHVTLSALIAGVAATFGTGADGAGAPLKANGRIELAVPAAPLGPIHGSDGDVPAMDVARVAIDSDGSRIGFDATLRQAPGEWATSVLTVYIDSDNNPATGAKLFGQEQGGFEYVAELDACADYADESTTCIGGSTQSRAIGHFGALGLARCKSDNVMDTRTVVDVMGFPGKKKATRTPIADKVVHGTLDYADLELKSGQTVRLLPRRSGGSAPAGDSDYFSPVLLTLE
jgi:hypothetical protein